MTCNPYVYADDSDDEHWVAYCPGCRWTGEPATSKQVAFLRLKQHQQQGEQ